MKTNRKIKSSRTFLFLTASFFLTAFFVFCNYALGDENKIVISEVMYDPAGTDTGKSDWLEIYNSTGEEIFFEKSAFGIIDEPEQRDLVTGKLKNTCHIMAEARVRIDSGEYAIIADNENEFLNSYPKYAGKIIDTTLELLSGGDTFKISLDRCKTWVLEISFKDSWGAKDNGKTLELIDLRSKYEEKNWQESFVKGGTPGKKLSEYVKPEIVEPKTYPEGISITELFPNPFQSQYEEYIELYNGTDEDVDLEGWMLRDASKTGKYIFGESVILKSKKYLAIFKEKFKFALNNSGDESVTLLDPNGKEVSRAEYNGSKKDVSFNLDGLRWRGSKFLTPGAENILNSEPYGKVTIDDEIFENAYADFFVSTGDADGEVVKVVWDFGDGHKSYLAKTRHKYEKTGTYLGSVKLSDGNEDAIENFEIEVKKYPHPKVRIIAISSNPEGPDDGEEFLTIENKSNKRINLNGWSIATGWKDFINHPIREDVIIKEDKTKKLTNDVSSFTLNNTKAKIQLRYPDGEVAHEVKYKKKDGIEDDEIYQKVKGGWTWFRGKQDAITKKQETNNDQDIIINIQNGEEVENIKKENPSVSKESEVAGVETEKRKNTFVMLKNDVVIGKVEIRNEDLRKLGIENVRKFNGQYILTLQGKDSEHYAVTFFKNISSDMNAKLNSLLNFF